MVANTFMRAPGESVGTFALESAHGRAGGRDRASTRSSCGAATSPRRIRPRGCAFSVAPPRRGLSRAAPSASAGTGAIRTPARAARRRMAGRAWACATAHLSLLPHARRRGAHHARPPTAAPWSQMAAHEMGMGTATVQAQHAAERLGLPLERVRFELRRHRPARPARWPAARRRPPSIVRRGHRGAARSWSRELLKLAGNDSPARRARARTRSRRATAACARRDEPERHESYASILARGPARRASRARRRRRRRWRCRSTRCTPTARSSARCASTR